jgi:hypothetical protein
VKFQRFSDLAFVEKLVSERFSKRKIPITIEVEWRKYATTLGDEFLEAYKKWHEFEWWLAPNSVLFSDFGGLGFLPDEVFSYYLPGCILKSFLNPNQFEWFEKTFYRISRKEYKFQSLGDDEILAVGWYLRASELIEELKYDGSLNIAISKVCSRSAAIDSTEAAEVRAELGCGISLS